MKVFVYWNLHKNLWSVKALDGEHKGRVILRSTFVTLENPVPKVSEVGRQRVLREQRKNVHAGITGTLVAREAPQGNAVSYNPYKGAFFYFRNTGAPVTEEGHKRAHFTDNRGVFFK